MNNKIREILETRKTVLTEHIRLDKNCLNDAFLNQFMEGRVKVEESWLEETQKLLTSVLDSDALLEVLQNREAILKIYIADARGKYKGLDGQEMRGRMAVSTYWLDETKTLINLLDK